MNVTNFADLNNVINSGTLTINNGADIASLENIKTTDIYNGLNADYIKNDGTLNLTNGTGIINNIVNNSQININNAEYELITSVTGNGKGNMNITSSKFTSNGNIHNQNITADNSTLNFSDNSELLKDSVLNVTNASKVNTKDNVYTDYVLDELHSSADSRYSIDLILTRDEQKADTFTLKNGGSGTIYISSINVGSNVINESNLNESFVIQIIKSATQDAPQLDYDDSKVLNQAVANMTSDIILAKDFGLASTTTINDSLEIRGLQDTFVAWANYLTPVWSGLTEQEDKTFTFVDDSTTFLTKDVSELKGYNLTINGANNTFDVNGYDLMSSINKDQNVSISNINITGNNDIATDNKGILSFNNVTTDKDIINNNTLNLTNNINLKNLTNNGTMDYKGDLWQLKDFENTGKANIVGITIVDNITNSGDIDAVGDIYIDKDLNNDKTGDIFVDGSVSVDTINNSGYILINDDVRVNEINNTGTAIIKGDTIVRDIINEEGVADVTGNLIVYNILNDDIMNVIGNIDTTSLTNEGKLTVKDSIFNIQKIETEKNGTIDLTDTEFNTFGKVENQEITANTSTINVFSPYQYTANSLALNQSTMNIGDLTTEDMHFTKLDINDGSTININSSAIDFTTDDMGRITADEYDMAASDAIINLYNINVLNDIDKNREEVRVKFADESFAQNVQYHGQKTVYTPLYKYGTSYDFNEGEMVFIRGGYYNPQTGGLEYPSNPSSFFNPAVLSSAIGAQVAAAGMINQTFNYAFQNSDNFMLMANQSRLAKINENKLALAGTGDYADRDNKPMYDVSPWFKPYVSFESIPLDIGPKVSSTNYGSLIGFDTPYEELRNGWVRAYTIYGGYNGANARYDEVDVTQNGAVLGGTVTFYKGNFYNATTLTSGVTFSENSTMFGTENTILLLGGVGNKTGYNIEFKDGKFILQPNIFLAYTFVKNFDYRNAAGIRVESEPLHTVQVAPGMKFIANTKNGWQPFIAANVVMNFLNKSRVVADNVTLPRMSIKPYVQYGIGIQKVFKDNFMAFGSAMLQNGGRNGITLNFGLKWSLDFNNPFDDMRYRGLPELVQSFQVDTLADNSSRQLFDIYSFYSDDNLVNIQSLRAYNDKKKVIHKKFFKNKNVDKDNIVNLKIGQAGKSHME